MNYAIALTPMIPMRENPSECAEMTSQLLFGETFRILEEQPKWLFVECSFDDYAGWIDRKMATMIDKETYCRLTEESNYAVSIPFADIRVKGNKMPIRVSIGSILPGYTLEKHGFKWMDKNYSMIARAVRKIELTNIQKLIRTAELYLNTSYLWGGRSMFGIDCSGFVQQVYRLNGVNLLRNASQQVTQGVKIDSFEEIIPGDLAFFSNKEGRVTHVGIVYTPHQIIHCSGDVHIDTLTPQGIWSDKQGCYTHGAPQFRRFDALLPR